MFRIKSWFDIFYISGIIHLIERYDMLKFYVTGYKSIANRICLDIKPLTVLAGSNSSGKSSIVQPLLLLKQTIESQTEPDGLLLYGPHVKFTRASQILSSKQSKSKEKGFILEFENSNCSIAIGYVPRVRNNTQRGLRAYFTRFVKNGRSIFFNADNEIDGDITDFIDKEYINIFTRNMPKNNKVVFSTKVHEERGFLDITPKMTSGPFDNITVPNEYSSEMLQIQRMISNIIHIPGLRGNPNRVYPILNVLDKFPGNFENYSASILLSWIHSEPKNIQILNRYLRELSMTWEISPVVKDDTSAELKVSRLTHKKSEYISISDVGFGVSQVLPILIALVTAQPNQIVIVEQPELHLHPKAQLTLAKIFTEAAKKNVRVIVETHSSIFLRGIQAAVAKKELDSKLVSLNWFSRSKRGETEVDSVSIESDGSFRNWPQDFDDIQAAADEEFLKGYFKK